MAVEFHKMHGCGNDFVLLDLRSQSFDVDAAIARRLADRHSGVGCDQLLVLRPPGCSGLLTNFEVWNADGSRAEQCGNGVRCIARYLYLRGEASDSFHMGGPAATVSGWLEGDGQVRVDMGRPEFNPERIPIRLQPQDGWYRLETAWGEVRLGAVSLGNPHATIVVDDLASPELEELGHAAFPNGCNAGFARIIDRGTVRLRVFERGSGETHSCGSGACAAAAILRRGGLIEAEVEILQEGGKLKIEWPGDDERIMMTGPAVHVFQGTLE